MKTSKIVAITTCSFAIVTLASVGFATWLIGLQNETVELNDINVAVDNVTDNTSYLKVELAEGENGINISDTVNAEANVNGGVSLSGESNHDFDVNLSAFDIVYSEDRTFDSLTITTKLGENEWPSVSLSAGNLSFPADANVDGNSIKDNFGRSGEKLTFIELANSTNVTDLSSSSEYEAVNPGIDGYYFYKMKATQALRFKWGSMFTLDSGNVSPIEFYNKKLEGVTDTTAKLQMLNQIKTELSAMNAIFTGKTINIEIKLTTHSEQA